jgi:hypothetical protein
MFQEKLGKEACCQTVLRLARKWYRDLLTFGNTKILRGLAVFWYYKMPGDLLAFGI